MSDYDNTNKGVMFRPYPDQLFPLQGRLDIEGNERKIIAIKQPLTKGGEPVLVLYEQMGVLYPNDKKGNEKAPDYSGPLDSFADLRVAGWKGEKDGRAFLQLKVSAKQSGNGSDGGRESAPAADSFPNDEIPF